MGELLSPPYLPYISPISPQGHLAVGELLMAHGAEAGATNRFGRTAAEQAGRKAK